MDKLKGKRIMVWTFMGNSRMYEALRDYGDRIDTIGLFSFKVDATGTITESGVPISNMLTYINIIRMAHRTPSVPNLSESWRNTRGAMAWISTWKRVMIILPMQRPQLCSSISTKP